MASQKDLIVKLVTEHVDAATKKVAQESRDAEVALGKSLAKAPAAKALLKKRLALQLKQEALNKAINTLNEQAKELGVYLCDRSGYSRDEFPDRFSVEPTHLSAMSERPDYKKIIAAQRAKIDTIQTLRRDMLSAVATRGLPDLQAAFAEFLKKLEAIK